MPPIVIRAILLVMAALMSHSLVAQLKSKTLIIRKYEKYTVGPTNALILDTLIMENRSSLHFSPEGAGTLIVANAIIGKDCLISSRGTSAFIGGNGGDLSLTMNFVSLASLEIDSRGGDGHKGTNGHNGQQGVPDKVETYQMTDSQGKTVTIKNFIPGTPATSGSSGTPGGPGGNGGNVSLTYGTPGFIINFNNSKSKHSINIRSKAGKSSPNGMKGIAGQSFRGGIIENTATSGPRKNVPKLTDGEIQLSRIGESN